MTGEGEHLLEIINAQNEIAAGGLDLPAVMDLVARRAVELTNADGSLVEMADGTDTVYAAGAGRGREQVGARAPMEGSLSGLSIRTGQVLSSDNTDSDDRADSGICQRIGAGSMIVVPLAHGGGTVGALTVYSAAIYHFRSKDIETLRLLAGLISAHMAQASDYRGEVRNSRTDPLTGLGNRRAYDEALAAEIARCRRHDGTVSLAIFDLDGLGAVSDELGAAAVDEVLRGIAEILGRGRGSDAAFHLEAGQFAMVLPETDEDGAKSAATRISSRIGEAGLGGGRVRASWGIASGEPGAIEMHELAARRLGLMRTRAAEAPAASR
jgi:diguanylate cyclase (GGDEF)-like protein